MQAIFLNIFYFITFVQPMFFLVDSFQTPTKHLTGIEKKISF